MDKIKKIKILKYFAKISHNVSIYLAYLADKLELEIVVK